VTLAWKRGYVPGVHRPELAFAVLGLLVAPSGPSAEEGQPKACESSSVLEAYGLGTPWDDLARMAQDVGAAPLRPDLIRRPADRSIPVCAGGPALPMGREAPPPGGPGPTLELVPGILDVYGNATYPRDSNDGALWQGKGMSAQLALGGAFRWGILSAAIVPSVAWQQNVAFRLVPNGRTGDLAYMDPWYPPSPPDVRGDWLDMPQRFGPTPFWTVSPGQSYLRLDYGGFATGISTENMWWGPAMLNSILMSNTAAGFPHAFLGTARPVDIGIGKLEAQVYMGRLDRSKYFPDQGHAWFYALIMDYEPRWVPGLYLGLAWVNLKTCACLEGAVDSNSLAGLYGRWVFPPVGFEVYGEWMREDYAGSWQDFMMQPDHSQGFTLGLQKVWAGSGNWVRFRAEATDVAPLRPPLEYRPAVTYYVHGGNLSYTNGGQLIGAAIGPGGSSQYLGVDLLTNSGWYGGYLERVRRHEDVYLYQLAGQMVKDDAEITVGLRYVHSFGILDLGVDLAFSHRYGWDFMGSATNAHLGVELTLWPPRTGPPG
jgi:hypothetical protein